MMRTLILRAIGICAVAAQLTVAQADVIVNGGFESGLSSWTRTDYIGSDGTFSSQSGTLSPQNGFTVAAPVEGSFAAMTDQAAGGAHVLYQDFVVPVGAFLWQMNFSLYINNGATTFHSPATLDWAATDRTGANVLNQQARVDLMRDGADAFSVAAGDVLQNLFHTSPGDPAVSGYTAHGVDVTATLLAMQGQTVRLRFAEADNVSFFNFGVDLVSLEAIPEPGSIAGLATALLAAGLAARRRR